jgi:hypothetical protein
LDNSKAKYEFLRTDKKAVDYLKKLVKNDYEPTDDISFRVVEKKGVTSKYRPATMDPKGTQTDDFDTDF